MARAEAGRRAVALALWLAASSARAGQVERFSEPGSKTQAAAAPLIIRAADRDAAPMIGAAYVVEAAKGAGIGEEASRESGPAVEVGALEDVRSAVPTAVLESGERPEAQGAPSATEERPSAALFDGQAKRSVALIVELHGGSWRPAEFIGEIGRRFPGRPVRLAAPRSKAEVAQALAAALQPGDEVTHLVFSGHGSTGREGALSLLELYVGKENFALAVPRRGVMERLEALPGNDEALAAFSALRGRLARGAKILMSECLIMAGGRLVAANKARALAQLVGVEDFELYANRTLGLSLDIRAIERRIWNIDSMMKNAASVVVALVLWALSVKFLLLGLIAWPVAGLVGGVLCLALMGSFDRGYQASGRAGRISLKRSTLRKFWPVFFN